jgi:antitoxin FitA
MLSLWAVMANLNQAMANLSVRNLDNDLLAKLKRRAARHGRSAEAEVREILRLTLSSEADIDFDPLAAELRALTAGRRHTPAEDLVREGRDGR